jgi:hypothetical protein
VQVSQTTRNHLILNGIKPQTVTTKPTSHPFVNIVKNEFHNIWKLPYSDEFLILLQNNFLKNISACTITKWENTPVSFCLQNKQPFPLKYEKDDGQYLLIDKRPKLRDYTLLGVLQILKATKKISPSQFQQSKRRLENGEKLRDSILENVNMFYKNIRLEKDYKHVATNKNTPKDRITHEINGGTYSILLKTYAQKVKHDTTKQITQEVNKKYVADNKIIPNF